MKLQSGTSLLAGVLMLSSCSNAVEKEAVDSDEVVANADDAAAPAAPAAGDDGAAEKPDYAAYEGKFATDEINGSNLLNFPPFVAAVKAATKSEDVQQRVLWEDAPSAPIEMLGGRLIYEACEEDICDAHNWKISVGLEENDAVDCYYDKETMGDVGDVYIGGELADNRGGGCTAEGD